MSLRYLRDKKRFRFEFEATINGQRIRASKVLPQAWDKSKADAYDKKESARLYAEATGIERPGATIEQAVNLYVNERCPNLKNGKGAAEELARIYHAYAGRRLDELPEVAQEYVKLESGRLKDATIKNRLAYLKAACRYAFKFHKLGDHNPAERMQLPTPNNERHNYATRKQMLTIARLISKRHARAAYRIAFYSGMRISEILRCELVGNCFLLQDTKNGDRRMIPIHPKVNSCLRYFPFTVKKRGIQRLVEHARKAADLWHLTFHDMRHSAASEMVNNGVSLYEVGTVLGHRDPRSTQRYSHLSAGTLTAAVGLIGRKSRTGQK